MKWYGGLGIVVFSLALVMQPGLIAKGLAVSEFEADDLVGGHSSTHEASPESIWCFDRPEHHRFLVGRSRFIDAVQYTFSAVLTGGFAPNDGSLAMLGWPAQVCITLMCLAGAIPLTFYFPLFFTTH